MAQYVGALSAATLNLFMTSYFSGSLQKVLMFSIETQYNPRYSFVVIFNIFKALLALFSKKSHSYQWQLLTHWCANYHLYLITCFLASPMSFSQWPVHKKNIFYAKCNWIIFIILLACLVVFVYCLINFLQ